MEETENKNPEGRPLLFKTPEALQIKCDAYFELMEAKQKPFTVSGLASYLDTSRQTLINYEKKDEFFDTVRRAKEKCEAFAEEQLYIGKNPSGVQFALKNNFEWRDKQELDHTTKGEKIYNWSNYGNNPIPSAPLDQNIPREQGEMESDSQPQTERN